MKSIIIEFLIKIFLILFFSALLFLLLRFWEVTAIAAAVILIALHIYLWKL